jgi:hypothetical protein
MTALPSNLALVGEDLARATLRDARRSLRRRRAVTLTAIVAVLIVTATAAVANGWLFNETPTTSAVPSLGNVSGSLPRTLLTGLGPARRTLSSDATPSGSVCLTLTGFERNCVPSFLASQHLAWFVASPQPGKTLVWGIVRDDVVSVEAVSADGGTTTAQLGNDAFYLELSGGPPARLVARLLDGSTSTATVPTCPTTDPECAS